MCLTPAKLPGLDGTVGGATTGARSSLAMSAAANTAAASGTGTRRGGARKKRAHRANITERAIGSKVAAVGSRTTSNVKVLVSARKVQQYIRWIDSLRIWRKISSLGDEFRNGLLLCRLMEKLAPEHVIKGRNRKPVSRTAAISNIEKGLQVVYRGGVSHPNVPSADQIYRGESSKVASLVREVFEAFVMKRVRAQAGSTMRWVAATVAHYDAYFPPLAPATCRYPYAGAWSRLRSGTLLACVLHFFCGDRDDDGANLPAVSLSALFLDPLVLSGVNSANDVATAATMHNVRILFRYLQQLGIPVVWDVRCVWCPGIDTFVLFASLCWLVLFRLQESAAALHTRLTVSLSPPSSSELQYNNNATQPTEHTRTPTYLVGRGLCVAPRRRFLAAPTPLREALLPHV